MGGSSFIALPKDIENKKAVINPHNAEKQFFKWVILAKHVTGENKYRVGINYTIHEDKYNFSVLSFPTLISEIKIFEKNNPNVSVNVCGVKDEKNKKNDCAIHTIFLLKVVDEEKADHFDLLLITKNDTSHYTYISNFLRLVRSQKTAHTEKVYFCKRCFTSFDEQR